MGLSSSWLRPHRPSGYKRVGQELVSTQLELHQRFLVTAGKMKTVLVLVAGLSLLLVATEAAPASGAVELFSSLPESRVERSALGRCCPCPEIIRTTIIIIETTRYPTRSGAGGFGGSRQCCPCRPHG
nr:uncharacterized protein LOC123767842 [Procambarus clarkii]